MSEDKSIYDQANESSLGNRGEAPVSNHSTVLKGVLTTVLTLGGLGLGGYLLLTLLKSSN